MNNTAIKNAFKLGQSLERLGQEVGFLKASIEQEELETAEIQASLLQDRCKGIQEMIGVLCREAVQPCPTCGCDSAAPGGHHHVECPHYIRKAV